jgi:myo-inositol-1(or 4)-monophosphatase
MTHVLTAALAAGRAAADVLRAGFGTSFDHRSKEGRHNLVTEFDTRCERLIIEMLSDAVPGSSFLGEEFGASGADATPSAVRWIIDPLDGTVNFAHSIPVFCVSIAAAVDNELVCGVIVDPMLRQEFTAVKGQGAFLNGERMRVTATDDWRDAFVVTGFPYNVHENPGKCIEQFIAMARDGHPIRRLGSAALDLAYVAAGRFDLFWEVDLHPWDMAAGVLLVTEAGGTVTHYDGRPFTLGRDNIIASNTHLHADAVRFLQEATQ